MSPERFEHLFDKLSRSQLLGSVMNLKLKFECFQIQLNFNNYNRMLFFVCFLFIYNYHYPKIVGF